MKTIKLKNIYFKFSEFKYNNISELKKEFDIISAKIGKHTVIGDDAVIGNHAKIGDDAKIGYHAVIGNHATIGCHVNLTKSIYITGSSHTLTYTGNNTLSIGCHNYTIDKWLEKFEIIGKKENYSLEQIEEYRKYILIIKQFAENENNFYNNFFSYFSNSNGSKSKP